jgi:hypothetical protein
MDQATVAHACNPSYSGGRDQADNGGPNPQIVRKTLSQKYPSQKGLTEWLKVKALRSSPSTTKKKKKDTWDLGMMCTAVILALGRQRQEYQEFKASLSYIVGSRLAWTI